MTMGFQDNPNNILGANSADNQFSSASVASNADGSIIERIEYLQSQVAALNSGQTILQGVAPAATSSTTEVVLSNLAGFGDDFFNNQFYMQVLHNDNSAGNAPEKQTRKITDYTSATGTFTMDAFGAAVEAGDLVLVLHESQVALGSDNNDNIFASTNVVANSDGSVLERLEHIKGLVGGEDSAATILGANDADNGFDSATVVANEDGSVLERLEQIQEATNNGTGTALATNKSLVDVLGTNGTTVTDSAVSVLGAIGANNANNAFDSSTVAANSDGSVLERLEDLKDRVDAVDDYVDTEVAAIKAKTDNLPASPANQTDINSAFTTLRGADSDTLKTISDQIDTVDTEVGDIQTDIGNASARTNLQSILAMLGNPDTAGASLYNAIVGGNAVANSKLGKKVTRAAADIFDGSQKALFTVATGKVLVTAITIEVTTAAIDAGASNTKLMTNPTVGTDANMCAVLDINADEAGTIYSLTGEPATALTGGSGGGANTMISPWVVAEGTIDIDTAADVGTGGALGYCELWYIPLDDGATVTAT